MPVITNQEFLDACFGAAAPDAHVTGFSEDPSELEKQGKKGYWGGNKWARSGHRDKFPNQNAYFTISVFDDDATGAARRRKELFRATHAIVLDDVGSKTDPLVVSKLPSPSWKLETSPGNYQWGYILDTPETNAGIVNALLDGLVAAGLCPDGKDPGMKGVTRYVRLPVGRNTKAKYGAGGFACRLIEWHPERRFTPVELAAPVGVVLPGPGATPATRSRGAAAGANPTNDVIYGHLDRWGMLRQSSPADGGYHCECPWLDEHTGRADSNAAVYPGGGFKCHHGHCETRNRADLVLWVDARLRAEGIGGLASCDFKDADKPTLDAAWDALVSRRVLTSRDVVRLASVPNRRDVSTMLRAAGAILGTNAKAIGQRLTRARKRQTRDAYRAIEAHERDTAQAACGTAVAALPGWVAPISLAEAQALTERGVSAILDPYRAGPREPVPLRNRGRRR